MLCFAWQWEVGIGSGYTTTMGNGTWYQEGFEHTLDLKHATWKLGVTDKINDSWNWHVAYVNLGVNHSNAIAADRDEDYSPVTQTCVPTGCNLARYVWSGSTNGIEATAEWHTNGPVQFGVFGGVFVFKPISRVSVTGWKASPTAQPQNFDIDSNNGLRPGAVVGGLVRFKDFDLSIQRYFNKGLRMQYTGIQKYTDVLMLTWRF